MNSTLPDQGDQANNNKQLIKDRILLVEDDLLIQTLHTQALRNLGYRVDVAANGKQALAYSYEHYAIIFLDIGLPDTSGIEICKVIRKTKAGVTLPIIALTAFGREKYKDCAEAGMNACFRKPISIDEFQTIINHWTNKNILINFTNV